MQNISNLVRSGFKCIVCNLLSNLWALGINLTVIVVTEITTNKVYIVINRVEIVN